MTRRGGVVGVIWGEREPGGGAALAGVQNAGLLPSLLKKLLEQSSDHRSYMPCKIHFL